MTDITTTRMNHLVDPALHVWAWQIPVYLFLGGLVAGMMVIAGWFLLSGRHRTATSVSSLLPLMGLALLSAGMLALFRDLEHKWYVWRLYLTFEWRSPMSWGAWILVAVYPALIATWLVTAPAWVGQLVPVIGVWSARLGAQLRVVRGLAVADIILGAMLGIYTGVLLSSLGARPAWNSALLGPLFLTSGLSGAAALVHLLASDHDESDALVRADNRLLQIELVIIALFFIGLATSTSAHRSAAELFFGGRYTAPFWVGVVGAGIIAPLIVQSLMMARRVRHTVVAPLLVIAGGFLLRFVVVSAGQFSHWRAF